MGRKRNLAPTVSTHRGQVRVRWTSDTGRHEVLLGPADDPAAWKAAHAKLLARLAADPNYSPAGLPPGEYLVAELARDYLAGTAVPAGTHKESVRRSLRVLCDAHAETPAAGFGPVEFADWRDALCRQTRADGEPVYTAATIRKYMGNVRRCWRWGVERGRLPASTWHALVAVKNPRAADARESRPVPPADDAAVEAILPLLRPPVAAMVRLQRLTGMRPGELFRLTPAQVLTGGKHTLPGAGAVDLDAEGVWVYLPGKHKNKGKGKNRWVPLGPAARAVLAPYLDRGPDVPCFSPKEAVPEMAGKGERPPGGAYCRQAYLNAVQRACDRAKVGRFTPYSIRHAFANQIDSSHGLDCVRHSLGHSSAQTSTRYAKVSFKTAARVAREVG